MMKNEMKPYIDHVGLYMYVRTCMLMIMNVMIKWKNQNIVLKSHIA